MLDSINPAHPTLADLATLPRWVAWRNERGDRKPTKVPYAAQGRRAEADNPATWRTRAQAEAVAECIVNGDGGGIGIELGDLGDGRHLAGIDLDTCRTPDGAIEAWAAEVVARIRQLQRNLAERHRHEAVLPRRDGGHANLTLSDGDRARQTAEARNGRASACD